MIPLAIGIAIPDEHARLARLETNASHTTSLCTAIGTAGVDLVHSSGRSSWTPHKLSTTQKVIQVPAHSQLQPFPMNGSDVVPRWNDEIAAILSGLIGGGRYGLKIRVPHALGELASSLGG